MCNEHQIALKVINEHIDAGSSFTYDQITREILDEGGILRTSIGVTIRMYLKSLKEIGLLVFDSKSENFKVNKNALTEHHSMA